MKLSEQIISEVKRQSEDLNRLRFGEVILKVQNGKVVWGEIKTVWKTDSNKREV